MTMNCRHGAELDRTEEDTTVERKGVRYLQGQKRCLATVSAPRFARELRTGVVVVIWKAQVPCVSRAHTSWPKCLPVNYDIRDHSKHPKERDRSENKGDESLDEK